MKNETDNPMTHDNVKQEIDEQLRRIEAIATREEQPREQPKSWWEQLLHQFKKLSKR